MSNIPLALVLMLSVVAPVSADDQIVMIGGVLSSDAAEHVFQTSITDLNFRPDTRIYGVEFRAVTIKMDPNPIQSALSVCKNLLKMPVYTVIVSHPPNNPLQPPISVSFTCGFYRIPVIGLSSRDSIFSDMNLHMTYMRTVPPFSHQAKVWLELVRYHEWKSVIIMHSADQEGRAMVARFQNEQEDKKMLPGRKTPVVEEDRVQVAKLINFVVGETSYMNDLSFTEDTRVILLRASTEDAETIFRDAAIMNMTGAGYVWIINELAMDAPNVPVGVLAVRLKDSDEETAHIMDAVRIVGQGFRKAFATGLNMSAPPSDCKIDKKEWSSGVQLSDILRSEEVLDGRTGHVVFDDFGDRMLPVYEIVNRQNSEWKVVGYFGNSSDANKPIEMKKDTPTVWAGGETTRPAGMKISTHLRVVTLESVPFVFVRNVASRNECHEDEVYCPKPNGTDLDYETPFCCRGYCIEMLEKMGTLVNFTYEVHLVADDMYGSLEKRNGSNVKEWNGMMGEIIRGLADLIVAPMTITPERAKDIEFTKPFKYQGMTILVRKEEKNSSLASFLQPFQDTLWILVGLSVHVVALVLYLLDRFSPFGRFKLAKSNDAEEDALNLSSAMWFAWGVLLNSGIGEGTPRSFSARVLGMVWAGFAMIIVASYTANLAAFLVLDRPEASISGIDDARLRNPEENFNYATVKNSAVEMYFKRQVELSTMYRTMAEFNYVRPEDAINDVKNKNLQAFIWDSSRLEYEAAKNCDLVTAGEMFGRSGFGVGMRHGSRWLRKLSLAILNMHETGFMEQLDTEWILVKAPHCPETDASPATLGLTNMAGVFMLVAGGILTGVMLIFIEILYKRRRGLKEKEMELAKTAADRWRGNIEKRKTLRKTLIEGMLGGPSNQGNHQTTMTGSTSRVPLATSHDDLIQAAPPYPTGPLGRKTASRRSLGAVSNPVYDGNFYEAV